MVQRFYLSNICRTWPISRQEALFDERFPGWRKAPRYVDELPPRVRKAHNAASLTMRASLLRRTARGDRDEVVTIASPAVLDWTQAGFLNALAAIADRGAALQMLEPDLTVRPADGAGEIARAAAAFTDAERYANGKGPWEGGKVSGERRTAAAKAKCEEYRHHWSEPRERYSDAEVAAMADVSIATIKKHLGKRVDAIAARAASEAQAERNRSRRKTR